jgi:hypothetical protein
MRYLQAAGVESEGVTGKRPCRTIAEIPDQWMPVMRQLHADLMMPPRAKINFHPGYPLGIAEAFKLQRGEHSLPLCGNMAARPGASDAIKQSAFGRYFPFDKRPVNFVHLSGTKLCRQPRCSLRGASKNHHP